MMRQSYRYTHNQRQFTPTRTPEKMEITRARMQVIQNFVCRILAFLMIFETVLNSVPQGNFAEDRKKWYRKYGRKG